MAVVDTAPASHVAGAPPVFWIVLPVTVTLTAFVHATRWQPGATVVGVAVAVGPDVLVRVGVEVKVNVEAGVTVALGPRFAPQMKALDTWPPLLFMDVSSSSG